MIAPGASLLDPLQDDDMLVVWVQVRVCREGCWLVSTGFPISEGSMKLQGDCEDSKRKQTSFTLTAAPTRASMAIGISFSSGYCSSEDWKIAACLLAIEALPAKKEVRRTE